MAIPAAIAAGVVNAGAGIIGNLITGRQNRKNVDKTIAANRELAEYSYSKDLELWNRANDFNSPEAQMRRLKEAGLNPNMVYGTGTQAAGLTQASMPRYNAPTVEYNYKPMVDVPGALAMYQDFQVRQAQIDNLRAQEQNTRARTATETLRTPLVELQGKRAGMENVKFADDMEYLFPYQRGRAHAEAQRGNVLLQQDFQKLRNMSQDELLKNLQVRYMEKSLSLQDIQREQKQADLLFSQYRNQWMKMGITSSDNILLRIFTRMMNESGLTPNDIF